MASAHATRLRSWSSDSQSAAGCSESAHDSFWYAKEELKISVTIVDLLKKSGSETVTRMLIRAQMPKGGDVWRLPV